MRTQTSQRHKNGRAPHRYHGVEHNPFLRLCPASGKASFQTEAQARRAVKNLRADGGPFLTVRRAYLCHDCGLFHMTSAAPDPRFDAHTLLRNNPRLADVVRALSTPNGAVFALTGMRSPVIDEPPMCIPWEWGQQLEAHLLVTASRATPDGFRQLRLTAVGAWAARSLSAAAPRQALTRPCPSR